MVQFHYRKGLGSVAFFTRNDASAHVILGQYFRKINTTNYSCNEYAGDRAVVICDDPIAVIAARVKFNDSRILYFALEMFEGQRGAGFLNWAKNCVYYFANRLAHVLSEVIIYPSEGRLKYYENLHWSGDKVAKLVFQNLPSKNDDEINCDVLANSSFGAFEINSKIDKLIIVFAGSLGDDRGVNLINEISRIPFVEMHVFSNSHESNLLENTVLFHGGISRFHLLSLYQYFDIGLLSYENYPLNVKLAAPVKIWEYAEANMIIIGNDNYSLSREYKEMIDFIQNDDSRIYAFLHNLLQVKKKNGFINKSRSMMVSTLRARQEVIFDDILTNLVRGRPV